jgi:hypothetical protein
MPEGYNGSVTFSSVWSNRMLMEFGKYKGHQIEDVPLSYLKWWKASLIESLRSCGAEISRRGDMGLTEDLETRLSLLPPFKRSELLERLASARNEHERNEVLWLVDQKCREYSGETV